jgi:hypothetical protein
MVAVKVFISSFIGGYEHYRAAASDAIETLGHSVVRAEHFPAATVTPQRACLSAIRDSDLVLLLIGSRYGAPRPRGCRPHTRSIGRPENVSPSSSSSNQTSTGSRPSRISSTRWRPG